MGSSAEEQLIEAIRKYFREDLGRCLEDEELTSRLGGKKYREFLDLSGVPFDDKKVLDIGSGFGEALMAIEQKGAISYGIELDKDRVSLSVQFLKEKGLNASIVRSAAEHLPFGDEQFDIVHMRDVIEHVNSPKAALREASRVLKTGGHLLMTCPNYLYPYEGHYRIFFIPFTPKKLAKCYLRILKKPVHYIEDVNYITYIWLKLTLKKELHIKIIDNPFEKQKISEPVLIKSKFRRNTVRIVKRIGILSRNISYFSPNISIVGIKFQD